MNTTIYKFVSSKSYTVIIVFAILSGIVIASGEHKYLLLFLSLPLIFLSIKKPFVFPFGVYVALLPLEPLLVITGEREGPTLIKYIGLLAGMVLLFKGAFEKKLKWPDSASLWWILLVFYGLLSVMWAIDRDLFFAPLLTLISLVVLYMVVSSYKIDKSDFDVIKWCVIIGATVAAILTIFKFIENPELRATIGGDQNILAFYFIIPFGVSISMMLGQRKIMNKISGWIAAGIILFSIVITGSRGGFLGAITVFIISIFRVKQNIRQRIMIIIMIIIAGFLLVAVIPDFFVERWSEAVETGGASRLDIWYIGYRSLEKYWSFGAGLNNFPRALEEFGHHVTYYPKPEEGPHNIYLGCFVELGIIGLTLMIIAMVNHYHVIRSRFKEYPDDMVMLKASFWGILVSSTFLQTFYFKSFWLLWMMIMMYKNITSSNSSSSIISPIPH